MYCTNAGGSTTAFLHGCWIWIFVYSRVGHTQTGATSLFNFLAYNFVNQWSRQKHIS
jgi:hypothetical protein